MRTYRTLVSATTTLLLLVTWIYVDNHLMQNPVPFATLTNKELLDLKKELESCQSQPEAAKGEPKYYSDEEFERRLEAAAKKARRCELIEELFRRIQRSEKARRFIISMGVIMGLGIIVIGGVLLFPIPVYVRVFKQKPRKHTLMLMIILIGLFNLLALMDLPITKSELITLIIFNLTVLTIGGLFLYLLKKEN